MPIIGPILFECSLFLNHTAGATQYCDYATGWMTEVRFPTGFFSLL